MRNDSIGAQPQLRPSKGSPPPKEVFEAGYSFFELDSDVVRFQNNHNGGNGNADADAVNHIAVLGGQFAHLAREPNDATTNTTTTTNTTSTNTTSTNNSTYIQDQPVIYIVEDESELDRAVQDQGFFQQPANLAIVNSNKNKKVRTGGIRKRFSLGSQTWRTVEDTTTTATTKSKSPWSHPFRRGIRKRFSMGSNQWRQQDENAEDDYYKEEEEDSIVILSDNDNNYNNKDPPIFAVDAAYNADALDSSHSNYYDTAVTTKTTSIFSNNSGIVGVSRSRSQAVSNNNDNDTDTSVVVNVTTTSPLDFFDQGIRKRFNVRPSFYGDDDDDDDGGGGGEKQDHDQKHTHSHSHSHTKNNNKSNVGDDENVDTFFDIAYDGPTASTSTTTTTSESILDNHNHHTHNSKGVLDGIDVEQDEERAYLSYLRQGQGGGGGGEGNNYKTLLRSAKLWQCLLALLLSTLVIVVLLRSMRPTFTTDFPFHFKSGESVCFQEQDELRHAVSVLNYQFNQTRVEQVYNNYGDDMEDWCVGQLSNFSHVFHNQHHVEQVDLSQWDVSKATVMESMFDEAISFTGNIHNWHVSKVTSMRRMFHKAYAFNQDISQWDVSSVETMRHMFAHASSFNRPIGAWSTDSLSNVTGMFYHATAFNQDISQWEMSKVTDMAIMFAGATTFNQPLGDWDMSSVVSAEAMFLDAISFDQDLSQWNVSNMKFMQRMFENATSFKTNFSQWDFSSVTRMHRMFYGATNIHPVHSGLCDNPTFMALLQQDSWTMEDIFDNGQSCP